MPSIHIEIQGQAFDAVLPSAPVTIGKAEGADLRINEQAIAAEQCVLEPLPGGLHKLRDCNSGVPTRVNGISIKQVSLNEGDVIEVGSARIVYRTAGAEPMLVKEAAEPIPARPRPAAEAATTTASATRAAAPASAPQAVPSAPEARGEPQAATSGEPTPGRRAARTNKKSSTGLVVGALVALVALVAILMSVGAGDAPSNEAARREHEEALHLFEVNDLEGARAIWRRLAADKRVGALRIDAENGLQLIGDAEREMESKLERLHSQRLDLTKAALATARESFLRVHGEQQAARFDETTGRIVAAQAAWKRDRLAEVTEQIQGLIDGAHFADARAVWQRLARAAPGAVDVGDEVAAGLAAVDVAAERSATDFIERMRRWIAEGLTHRARKLIIDVLPRFEGTSAFERVKQARAEAQAAYDKPVDFGPGPAAPTKSPQGPTPAVPTTAKGRDALEARANAALASVAAQVRDRAFGEAASALAVKAAELPAGEIRARLEARVEDLRLAERGFELLVGDINANPRSYLNVMLNDRLKASLVEADREVLSAAVRGGRSKWRWSRMDESAFGNLVERMQPDRNALVPLAALLQGVGLTDRADALVFKAGQKGVPTETLFPLLARWRGEAQPPEGYVVHGGRYVTQARREFLIREARIEAALENLDSRESLKRREAYAELLNIGEPARQRYRSALERRRAFLAQEIGRSKSGGKYKAKLLGMLDERRKHALALIYDAQAYPYPNPTKKNQKEVEERVDKVREVWERPFDLVAQWDKRLGGQLELVTEVDEALSDLVQGYQPDLDGIKAGINKALDVPGAADGSMREYSVKVLAYNETLPCTATEQEKDNTRIVNEYRMMMGLPAVKLEERLLRAARGHSRHMAQNGYFAHDVPPRFATAKNKSPGARAKAQGFGGGVGENIARGPGTGRGAFWAWFRSSGHHRNMLGRSWLQMGCGRANGSWWTQLFAGGSKSLKHPDPLPPPEAPFAPDPETEDGRPMRGGPAEVPDEAPPGDEGMPQDPPEGDEDDEGR
jgi:uncharacterized protein YkwD/pSer/pThr/pTyr-binding forkhead associated (FHA) protein